MRCFWSQVSTCSCWYRPQSDTKKVVNVSSSSPGFPPVFKRKIRDKAYNVGDSCSLKVHIIANPPASVSWYRNDELLTDGGRIRTSHGEDGHFMLTVLSTKPHDFGVYKCVARNKYGKVTCRARMLCGGEFLASGWLIDLLVSGWCCCNLKCQMNATRAHLWQVKTGSGKAFVPPGYKPLSEPMLKQQPNYLGQWWLRSLTHYSTTWAPFSTKTIFQVNGFPYL